MKAPWDKDRVRRHLPSPAERPEAEVVIYDGNCRFCTVQVNRIDRLDSRGRLAYLSLHDPEVAKRYPDISHDQLMEQMVLIDGSERRHAGAAALRRLTLLLPTLYLMAPIAYLPGTLPVWNWLYRQIATRRYLIAGAVESCESGTCSLHGKK